MLCGSSDEDFELPSTITRVKVKSFHTRAAWTTLEAKGLPHILGCSIYPGHSIGMTYVWGGRNQRTEVEALFRCIRAILEACNLGAQPKDKLWKDQLAKVLVETTDYYFGSSTSIQFQCNDRTNGLVWLPLKLEMSENSVYSWRLCETIIQQIRENIFRTTLVICCI